MANPNDGNDLPADDQTTPEQLGQIQLRTITERLTAMQQEANEATTATRAWMETITRQLQLGFHVRVYPPIDPNRPEALDQRLDMFMSDVPPEMQVQLYNSLGARIAAANQFPSQRPGGEGAPAPSQDVSQSRSGDSDNVELQELRQSAPKQSNRIRELEDALKKSQADQSLTKTPHNNKPVRGPNKAQQLNEHGGAESTRDAQRRGEKKGVPPEPPATPPAGPENDGKFARRLQLQDYLKEHLDEDLSLTAADGTTVPGVGRQDRISDEDGQSERKSVEDDHTDRESSEDDQSDGESHEDDQSDRRSDDETVQNKRRRDKGKGRVTDASTNDESSQKSRTSPAANPSSDDDEPLVSTEHQVTSNAAMRWEKPRRQSQRNVDKARREAEETERGEIKTEECGEPPSKPYVDPKTGRPVRGWVVVGSGSEEEKASSDSGPRERNTKNAKPSKFSKAPADTGADAPQATDTPEAQALMGPKEASTDNDEIHDKDTFQRSNQSIEDEEVEAADSLLESFRSDNDSSNLAIPAFRDDLIPGPINEDEDQDDEEEQDFGNWVDGVEAKNPNEAHIEHRRHPSSITKHANAHQPSTAHFKENQRPESSWVRRLANDGNNNEASPAKTGKKRKSNSPSQAAESDGEDQGTSQSPEKKQKPNNAKPTPGSKNKKTK
ncbi:hypothetical protein MBLNU13_g08051t1 [Cladosporium sp. NU13]